MTPPVRSRKVLGYVKAYERADRLRQRHEAKLDALEPLRERVQRAYADVTRRLATLSGGQRATAERMLKQKKAEV